MDKKEIEKIAKKRGVLVETVKRWVREGGDVYARTHVPGAKKHRGKEIVISSDPNKKPIEVTEDRLAIGDKRRACEILREARELGNEHLLEVWER